MTKTIFGMTLLAASVFAQAPGGKSEFDAASIRVNQPETGFHAPAEAVMGGPGTGDPTTFRCSNCSLATLVGRAYELQNYQMPGRAALGDKTFEVTARVPAGATSQEFQAMLQNLLKERFGLAFHYTEKKVKGYQLVVAKSGSKLKESGDGPRPAAEGGGDHGGRGGGGGNQFQFGHGAPGGGGGTQHNGLIAFGGTARYRGDHMSAAEIARLLSDQLSLPVNDETGLKGKYDVALTWSGNVMRPGNRPEAFAGGAGHGDHGGGAGPGGDRGGDEPSGPGLMDAVQAQLGLKLVAAEQAVAKIFVVDHVNPVPTAN